MNLAAKNLVKLFELWPGTARRSFRLDVQHKLSKRKACAESGVTAVDAVCRAGKCKLYP